MLDFVPADRGALFSLGPFRLVSPSDLRIVHRKPRGYKEQSFVAVFAQSSRARVKRFSASRAEIDSALSKSEKSLTRAVIVGEFAGMTRDDDPVFRVIAKAKPNPLSNEALTRWINQASRRLNILAASETAEMIDEMLEWIDFDWATASGDVWVAARAGIEGVFRAPSAGMIIGQRVETAKILRTVLRDVTGGASRIPGVAGNLAAGFRLPNRAISQAMMQHHGFFVRDRYRNIAPGLASRVQPIITRGIEQGMGRREIARELTSQVGRGLQQKGYWETVAANAVTRSRSYSLASSFSAAGINAYRIEAIVDEVTTETCLMLHEMILPVGPGLANLNRIISPNSTPQDTMRYQPFIRLQEGEFRAEYGDGTHAVVGTSDGQGQYTRVPPTQMAGAGVGFPPYHHRCRTTVVPEIL